MSRTLPRACMPGGLALFLVLSTSTALAAQANLDFARGEPLLVGFTVKPTDQMRGAGIVWLPPGLRGWGLLLEGRLPTNRPPDDEIDSDRTRADALGSGDRLFRTRSSWTALNGAAVRGVTPELALYLGAGMSWQADYEQYTFERQTEVGPEVVSYWIEDAGAEARYVNVVVGGIYRMGSRLAFQLGGQSAPRGFVIGGYLLLR